MAEIDSQLIRELAAILDDTGLTEIEVERGDLKIRVARAVTVAAPAPTVQHLLAPAPAPVPAATPEPPAPAAPAASAPPRGDAVTSPMVGTIYLQARPGDPPLCQIGDKVAEGQTLMIVEAMKTMNPIPAPRAGTVVEVLVGNETPVEYGTPLVVLE